MSCCICAATFWSTASKAPAVRDWRAPELADLLSELPKTRVSAAALAGRGTAARFPAEASNRPTEQAATLACALDGAGDGGAGGSENACPGNGGSMGGGGD